MQDLFLKACKGMAYFHERRRSIIVFTDFPVLDFIIHLFNPTRDIFIHQVSQMFFHLQILWSKILYAFSPLFHIGHVNNKISKDAFLEFNLTLIFAQIQGKLIDCALFCAKQRGYITNLTSDTIIEHPVDLPFNNITTEHLEWHYVTSNLCLQHNDCYYLSTSSNDRF